MDRQAKILVVDDDPDFLESVRIMLESDSYQVAIAQDEKEALAKLESERPDLLILDVMMAKWDSGFRFAWKLKAGDRYQNIPILMVTSVDEKLHIDFASHANSPNRTPDDKAYLPVDGYIVKPIKTTELLNSVKWILEHAESRAASR